MKCEATMIRPFRDRVDAGKLLARKLDAYVRWEDVLVLGLPRGGLPVAFEVARALDAPLDVFVVRKLGVPGREELAMGAIASGGALVVNEDVVEALHIPDEVIQAAVARESKELARREQLYRDDRPPIDVHGRTVILVDDGIATGSTMRAAVRAVRGLAAARLVIAVPAAAPSTWAELSDEADECVCCILPDPFYAVGVWYENFAQTTDEEVRELLERAELEITAALTR